MRNLILAIAAAACGCGTSVQAAPVDCAVFMAGDWAGKGEVAAFGSPIQLDNAFSFGKDGTFKGNSKYRGEDGIWQEQPMEGRWTAAAGSAADTCEITLTSESTVEGGSFSSSSTSTYAVVDDDTVNSGGLDLKRTGN